MKAYIIFWTIVIFFSLASFIYMSYFMLVKGIPELKDMFRQLRKTEADPAKVQEEE
jgi:hypothetical protein